MSQWELLPVDSSEHSGFSVFLAVIGGGGEEVFSAKIMQMSINAVQVSSAEKSRLH